MMYCNFRERMAQCDWRALQQWEIEDMVGSQDSLSEATRLLGETTFLSDAGLGMGEDRRCCLSGILSWIDSEQGDEYLLQKAICN